MKAAILAGIILASGAVDTYHWVVPPSGSAGRNIAPSSGDVTIAMGHGGSRAATASTEDGQLTLILPGELFRPAEGARGVRILIEPVDPSSIALPSEPLVVIGNVYRIRTFYVPGNAPAPMSGRAHAIAVYPVSVASADRTLTQSTDGVAWTPLASVDTSEFAQVEGDISSAGFLAVAGRTVAASPIPRVGTPGPNRWIVGGLILLAVASGAVGVTALVRDRLRRAAGTD